MKTWYVRGWLDVKVDADTEEEAQTAAKWLVWHRLPQSFDPHFAPTSAYEEQEEQRGGDALSREEAKVGDQLVLNDGRTYDITRSERGSLAIEMEDGQTHWFDLDKPEDWEGVKGVQSAQAP